MTAASRPRRARSYRGLSAEQRRSERRQRLLAAGKSVFGEDGFHAATVRQVCAEAGLTERYFYESFTNLAELFGAVYDGQLELLRERIVAALAAASPEPESLARSGLTEYYGSFKRDRHMARILLIEVYAGGQDLERIYQRGVADFAELIRGIIDHSLLPAGGDKLRSSLLATGLVGAAIHLGIRWFLEGCEEDVAVMVDNHMIIFGAVIDRLRAQA